MLITRVSKASGIERTLDIPCTQEQYETWENGGHIQHVMPHLSENDREFIISGIVQEEWDELFPEENDDNSPYDDEIPF